MNPPLRYAHRGRFVRAGAESLWLIRSALHIRKWQDRDVGENPYARIRAPGIHVASPCETVGPVGIRDSVLANARAAHRPAVAPLRFGTALFAMVLLVFALAQAAPSATPLRVVYAGDAGYPPFDFVDERGRATGFDVELFRAVAAHAGLDVDYRLGPWESVIADLHARRVDVVPMLVTEERARRLRFSEPFLRSYHLVFGRRGSAHVADLQALAGHRVAAQIAGVAWEELRRARGVRIVPVDVEGDALRAVQDGRADYAVAPMYIGYEAIQRHGLRDVVSLSPPLLEREYAFAVLPDRQALLARINAGLHAASRSGEKQRLYLAWLANLTPREPYLSGLRLGILVALPVLAAAIVLLVWWRRARQRAAAEALSRAQAEARADHLALHDPVTQLANRHGLRQALEALIAQGRPFAAIRLELLELEPVEAIAGHAFVEQLLHALAQRLREHHSGPVARISDQGFVVVCLDRTDAEGAETAMRALVRLTGRRLEVAGVPFELSACAGATLHPDHGGDVEEVLRAAAIACAAARMHPGSVALYTASLVPDPRNLTLLADLRRAIREHTLGYALQPKYDLRARRVSGAELLVRWDHPAYGPLPPSMFVPLAEKTEVVSEMTLYLVRRAAAHCREWKRQGLRLGLSVNVSANDVCNPALVGHITGLGRDIGSCLTLEITETAMMRDPALAFATVRRLRAHGVRISLDDFGTGHASLSYLRQLAPDEVKIDRSFTAGIFGSGADQSIVCATIELAHNLGASVTAEGVEDSRTLEWLAKAGCDAAQGYYIARPIPPHQFSEYLLQHLQHDGHVTLDPARPQAQDGAARRH